MTSIVEEALALVEGKRSDTYGFPEVTMDRVGRVWGILLGGDPIPAEVVALMMVALKLVRETRVCPQRDNLVDAVGYLIIAERCQ